MSPDNMSCTSSSHPRNVRHRGSAFAFKRGASTAANPGTTRVLTSDRSSSPNGLRSTPHPGPQPTHWVQALPGRGTGAAQAREKAPAKMSSVQGTATQGNDRPLPSGLPQAARSGTNTAIPTGSEGRNAGMERPMVWGKGRKTEDQWRDNQSDNQRMGK